jgi:hypothetical protein
MVLQTYLSHHEIVSSRNRGETNARQVARNTGKIFAQGPNKQALRGAWDLVGEATRCLMTNGNINH